MTKILITAMLFSMAAYAQTSSDANFLKQATGRFDLVKSESTDKCLQANFKVEYHSAKEAILGSDCGAVLWAAGADDPMGVFFCRADSPAVQGQIKIDISKGMGPSYYSSEAGKINNANLKMVMEAKDNSSESFEEFEKVEDILTVTDKGINLVNVSTWKNGKTETSKCVYKRRTTKK